MLSTLAQLSDEDIDRLIADHWREIRGLLREKKRRIKGHWEEVEWGYGASKFVPDTNNIGSGDDFLDRESA